ncbi:SDR family NAD(P)-dependent oxidoreductase [Algiphilus sp.]|uniref:SDR family NAD(P)-dependent oxidoreductase n=1 Tax=Algiphilus sp. TaxID=1872431 RepID=UPI003B52E12A
MAEPLEGRRVVITGASSGIGSATARSLAAAGAELALWDVDADGVRALAETLDRKNQRCLSFVVDVRSDAAVQQAITQTIDGLGGLDGAFNNAGIGAPTVPFEQLEENDFDQTLAANLKGVWLCMRHQLRHMLAQGSGSIVNNASISGLVGLAGQAAYTASKHGVVGLTKAASVEAAEGGVRVNAICPGAVRTRILQHLEAAGITEEVLAGMSPQARIADPTEIAGAVLWLLSGQSTFVTGAAIPIDGGWTAR